MQRVLWEERLPGYPRRAVFRVGLSRNHKILMSVIPVAVTQTISYYSAENTADCRYRV